jgi:IMP dehydrogenase
MECFHSQKISSRFFGRGFAFDDVLLIPRKSDILPSEACTKSSFANLFSLKIPILSAAMDTVTEVKMAESIARSGGLGVIHKNIPPELQAEMVSRVKKSQSGVITTPLTSMPHQQLRKAFQVLSENNISSLPILDNNNILVGILTKRDVQFIDDKDTLVSQVMTPLERMIYLKIDALNASNWRSVLDEASVLMRRNKIEKCPIIRFNGELIGLVTKKDIDHSTMFPHATTDAQGRLRVAAAIGVSDPDIEQRLPALIQAGVDAIFIDTAHGHSTSVIKAVEKAALKANGIPIIAGNIATPEAALSLKDAGANGVKVGIGPGSICTTRVVAGVGVPQLTAILNVAEALSGSGMTVVADGGLRSSGDIVKALAAGANFVMAGSLLAGTEQAPGEKVSLQGKWYKSYRGMGSLGAMKLGGKERYFQGHQSSEKKLVPEGIEGQLPFKGDVSDVLFQIIGGLKSGMGYLGCRNLEELRTSPKFIEITNAGLRESHVHNVTITQESPNYNSRGYE